MKQENGKEALIQVKDLKKYFPILRGVLRRQVGAVQAVDSISFNIYKGETLGLVGESGCGKSTAGRSILHLLKPTDGQVFFQDKELTSLSKSELRKVRRDMQIIFQDPFASLNPRMTVGSIVNEPLQIHRIGDANSRKERVNELLDFVGLNLNYINRYPHEFSGGQRQRIGIARALATNPCFIVADEPISALDVSIQAQVVNLLDDLKAELNLTYLFIAHDLSMVRYISDRVAVMYLGRIVELSDESLIFKKPLHPYTQALLSAIPIPDPVLEESRHRTILEGDVPSPADPPEGCHFHPRCQYATDICHKVDPEYRNMGTAPEEHWVACHHAEDFM
jgi:oligopeptide transport system ATP-binding protein